MLSETKLRDTDIPGTHVMNPHHQIEMGTCLMSLFRQPFIDESYYAHDFHECCNDPMIFQILQI